LEKHGTPGPRGTKKLGDRGLSGVAQSAPHGQEPGDKRPKGKKAKVMEDRTLILEDMERGFLGWGHEVQGEVPKVVKSAKAVGKKQKNTGVQRGGEVMETWGTPKNF